ncbi:glycoside hydrolase family 55 protein [Cohnella sp. GbtcB17]|uniref:glycoside hydrolase family 55 protein n=1 Tax=Cohnella sp. GbtcB17 TaxID=2824762 RepID=UPI001C2F6A2E|nr:glycoside hydrolase family 55 protein [Cohnella sp. GbtcB17]
MADSQSVQSFGASGNGMKDDTDALRQAVQNAIVSSDAGNGSTVTFGPGIYRIASDTTLPASLNYRFADGAMLAPDPGVTVTVLGSIEAGMATVFGGKGSYKGPMAAPVVLPQWFGASGSRSSVNGKIAKGSNKLTLSNPLDFRNGQYVSIPGGTPCLLSAPAGLKTSIAGAGGASAYTYTVIAVDSYGGLSSATAVTVQRGPDTISPDNAIVVSWNAVPGAAGYYVYGRTPDAPVRIARVQETSWKDNGAALRATEPSLPKTLPFPGIWIARIVSGAGSTVVTLDAAAAFTLNQPINHDDTLPIRQAIKVAGPGGKVIFPPGTYRISDTIQCDAAALIGNGRPSLMFVPEFVYDLKPCIDIVADTVVNGLQIGSGKEAYYLDNPAWADPKLFALQYYDMFVTGCSGFRVSGAAKPTFRDVRTATIKVGLLLDSTAGHIYAFESKLSGLIGVYCRLNTEDYYFESSDITGVFCGLLFGVKLISNHYGGFSGYLNRVHMGFSPYSIYQAIDDPDIYKSVVAVSGLMSTMDWVSQEQIGEAAIKLLPKSDTRIRVTGGFGYSWSDYKYATPRQGWQYALPDSLMPANQRQQYAAWFGTLRDSDIPRGSVTGNLRVSGAPGAIGSARIEKLATISDLEGLYLERATIVSKEPYFEVSVSSGSLLQDRTKQAFNAVTRGNLLLDPDNPASYKIAGGTLTIAASVDPALPRPMRAELGPTPVILMFTPAPNSTLSLLQIKLASAPFISPSNPLSMSLWAFTASQNGMNIRLNATGRSSNDSRFYYNQTVYPKGSWTKITGVDGTPADGSVSFQQVSIELPRDRPTYFAGLMLSEGPLAPYSPRYHIAADDDVELVRPGDGLVLTSPGGKRFRITVNDQGQISIAPMT